MMCPSCRVPYTSYVEVPNIFANLGDEWEGKGRDGKGREGKFPIYLLTCPPMKWVTLITPSPLKNRNICPPMNSVTLITR